MDAAGVEQPQPDWDFFIAYAGPDTEAAESLFELLAPHSRVFLDSRCVRPGVRWDEVLPRALASARVFVALVSSRTESSFYEAEEIARAIVMARRNPDRHRLVPVYLDDFDTTKHDPHYGLSVFSSLSVDQLGGLPAVARRLLDELMSLEESDRPERRLRVTRANQLAIQPYKGLDSFTEDDEQFFAGRREIVDGLVGRLNAYPYPRFMAVLGPSGGGKSSLIRAGLIPRLRKGGAKGGIPGSDLWRVVVTRPADELPTASDASIVGDQPLDLAKKVHQWLAALDERRRLVLVIDQFEELFTSFSDTLREAFVVELAGILDNSGTQDVLTVMIVMRNDFYHHFADRASLLVRRLEKGIFNVPSKLGRKEIEEIVREPARACGVEYEIGLVELLVEEAFEASPGKRREQSQAHITVLPLLEFALTELWERRRDGKLTLEHYQAIGRVGGVSGVLAQWANRAFQDLDLRQRRIARRILVDLVHLSEDGEGPDTRRRRPRRDLYRNPGDEAEVAAVQQVIGLLEDARLLVTAGDAPADEITVEIIHDALLLRWDRLRDWIEQDRQFLLWRQRHERRIKTWVMSSPDAVMARDPEELFRGRELDEASDWLANQEVSLSPDEESFIRASLTSREEERQRRQELDRGQELTVAVQVVSRLALAFPNSIGRSYDLSTFNRERTLEILLLMEAARLGAEDEATEFFERMLPTIRIGIEAPRYVESINVGCDLVRRNLTPGEWQEFFPGLLYHQTCSDLPPADPATWYNIGLALQGNGLFRDAIAAFDQVVAINPAFVHGWYQRAIAFLNSNRTVREASVAINPITIKADADYNEALRFYKRSVDRVYTEVDARILAVDAVYGVGTSLMQRGRYADAAFAFEQALSVIPDFTLGWNQRGNALRYCGRLHEAMECYATAAGMSGSMRDHRSTGSHPYLSPNAAHHVEIGHIETGRSLRDYPALSKDYSPKPPHTGGWTAYSGPF